MSRSTLSSRFARRAGAAALSVATAAALAVPAATADEADASGSALPSSESTDTDSEGSADPSSGSSEETPGDDTDAPETPETPEAEGSDGADVISSLAETDWVTLFKVLAAFSSGTVSSSTLADAAQLSADSGIELDDVIGSVSDAVAGSSDEGDDTGSPEAPETPETPAE
jgi:hypothetical protein